MNRLKPTKYTARYPRWMVGKPLLIASSALASLGDAMFGYSQGIMASNAVQPGFLKTIFGVDVTLDQIRDSSTGIDPWVFAITVSCLNITALFSSLGSAYVCDILGRRTSVRLGAIVYFISGLIQVFSNGLSSLIVGRCIQGVAVGILSMTVPILQCEIAPGHARGLFVSIEYLCLNLGYVLSAWVGYGFFFAMPSSISWRGPYILQSALAVLLFLWTFILPETPRWLIRNGFAEDGKQALADLHGTGDVTDPEIEKSFREITEAIQYEECLGEATWGQLFKQYTRRTVVGITCQMFAQLNGINAILYFLPDNLSRAGFSVDRALLYSGACALIYASGTLPTMALIDKLGRRKFLLFGSIALLVSLSAAGGVQFYSNSLPEGDARMGAAHGFFVCACVYLFFFGATWGPAPWLLGAEIFPIRARAKGMALSTASNWFFNFVVAFISPPLFKSIGGGYYFILAGFCGVSFFVVYLLYPETAFLTLEQLGEVFKDNIPESEKQCRFVVDESMSASVIAESRRGSDTTVVGDAESKDGVEKGTGGVEENVNLE